MAGITVKNAADVSEVLDQAIKQVGTSGNVVSDLLDKAYSLREAKDVLFSQRVAVRESLRNLDTAGILSAEQSAELTELFPPRQRGTADEDEVEETATA
jgi:hypothetical protein